MLDELIADELFLILVVLSLMTAFACLSVHGYDLLIDYFTIIIKVEI